MERPNEGSGDFLFAASTPGEYSLCLLEKDGAEKSIYMDITTQAETHGSEPGTEQRHAPGSGQARKEELKTAMAPMDQSIEAIEDLAGQIRKQQRYFRTRENRNLSTGEFSLIHDHSKHEPISSNHT